MGVILGLPHCESLGSPIILKTMTAHHSLLVYGFSQRNDKVLLAPPSLLSLWMSQQSDDSAVWDVRVPKVDPKEVSLLTGHRGVPFHHSLLRNAIKCPLMADMFCVNSDFPFSTCSVSDCTLPTFAICCFDVAVIFLRCHWALTTAKCGFRETSHQNTWRAKDCHYTTNGVFPSVASKNGFQLNDATWSRQRYCTSDFSSRIRSVSYIDVYELGINLTAVTLLLQSSHLILLPH